MIPVETPEIDIDQRAGAVRGGATLIDVREPSEYVAGHLADAVLIPMGQLPGRTARLDAGIDAYSVAGGTRGYAHSGRPVVAGSAARA